MNIYAIFILILIFLFPFKYDVNLGNFIFQYFRRMLQYVYDLEMPVFWDVYLSPLVRINGSTQNFNIFINLHIGPQVRQTYDPHAIYGTQQNNLLPYRMRFEIKIPQNTRILTNWVPLYSIGRNLKIWLVWFDWLEIGWLGKKSAI